MSNELRAMLAANEELTPADLANLKYPVWCSYKFDGIRGRILDMLVSRSGKLIPNLHIQSQLSKYAGCGLDGEIVTPGDFNDVQSAVMSHGGIPRFSYHVFDWSNNPSLAFRERYTLAKMTVEGLNNPCIQMAEQFICNSPQEVLDLFERVIEFGEGYDGIIIRDPDAPYKFGRSTLKQGWMIKYKPWKDSEAIITGFEELMLNENESVEDARGYSTKSKHQANLIPADTLGKFICDWNGKTIKIGGGKGMTDERRKYWWTHQDEFIGKQVNFKYLNLSAEGIPRHPNLRGIRLENV